ncbi:female protein [Larimichthys crocea]|uniref:female protein n=1 Tax=Larimichthys crocea TaxID=215358 RepID=UPI000F5E1E9C|nr:female protein [Larimichthys crocea]
MALLLLLAMLTVCAAIPQDLSGKMFTFPQETNRAHVKLITTRQEFSALTVCHRSITDLKRTHVLFSMSTSSFANGVLIYWNEANKQFSPYIRDISIGFQRQDYESDMWHSICTTWDSGSGLMQLWIDGKPSIRKFVTSGSSIKGSPIITIGQEQDNHGGGFDAKQSFVGMMSDVHMWDHILTPCEIQDYMAEMYFTPGNVLNWSALEFQIVDRVLIEDKQMTCH